MNIEAMRMVFVLAVLLEGTIAGADFDYKDALTKSLLFLEAQRSGKLPANNRIPWRGDSGLDDGKEAGVDLVGGYYDAGDNVKYGLPMAFTITTLSWGAIAFEKELKDLGELDHVHEAIRWGTDYFLKAAAKHDRLYVQVDVLNLDPGTEIAAETSAAMASSSLVFRHLLFLGQDELQWAATWLYMATLNQTYLQYVDDMSVDATVAEFNWDLKYAGSQVLLVQMFFQGHKQLDEYKGMLDGYICAVLPDSPSRQATFTPGGMLHMRDGANTQYVTGAALLFSIYSGILEKYNQKVTCDTKTYAPAQLLDFAKKQMDYILGNNPQKRSYMVGFGKNPPQQPHHRGASVPVLKPGEEVICAMTFVKYFTKNQPNPNVLTGAIVGGPDQNDQFEDRRYIGNYEEPCTYINSQAVGALAKLAATKGHSSS